MGSAKDGRPMTLIKGWSHSLRHPHPLLFPIACFIAAVLVAVAYTTWVNDRAQATQQQQGQILDARLCRTLAELYGEQPPAGNPRTNPSRSYLQGLHQHFGELLADLGCGR
jgi:hypothetical protein